MTVRIGSDTHGDNEAQPIDRLVAELDRLHRAAGIPSLRQVISAVQRRAPETRLGVTTLQNWFKGTTVPSNPKTFALVIEVLETMAGRRSRFADGSPAAQDGHYQPRGAAFWEGLRKSCLQGPRPVQGTKRPERAKRTDQPHPPPDETAVGTPSVGNTVPSPPAHVPPSRPGRRRRWLLLAIPPACLTLAVLAWGLNRESEQAPRAPQARTLHLKISPTPIRVPSDLDPDSFLRDYTDALDVGCKRHRGKNQAYGAVQARDGGVELGTFYLYGNLGGGCGVAWAEFIANDQFVRLHIKSIQISIGRRQPTPLTVTELWTPYVKKDADNRDSWTDALRVERGAVFTADLEIVLAH